MHLIDYKMSQNSQLGLVVKFPNNATGIIGRHKLYLIKISRVILGYNLSLNSNLLQTIYLESKYTILHSCRSACSSRSEKILKDRVVHLNFSDRELQT